MLMVEINILIVSLLRGGGGQDGSMSAEDRACQIRVRLFLHSLAG